MDRAERAVRKKFRRQQRQRLLVVGLKQLIEDTEDADQIRFLKGTLLQVELLTSKL